MSRNIKIIGKGILVCIICICAFLITAQISQARAPKIYWRSIHLGLNATFDITVSYLPEGAALIFKSKNKKIAKVDSKGRVTGKKVGKTSIIIKYKKDGKTYDVGESKVKVHNAFMNKEVAVAMKKTVIQLYGNEGYYTSNPTKIDDYVYDFYGYTGCDDSFLDEVNYKNKKASYTYVSSDKSKLKISKKGKLYYSKGTGKVRISIIETYKKKKRTMGSFVVNLAKTVWDGKKNVNGSTNQVYDIFKHTPYVSKEKVVFDNDADKKGEVTFLENSKKEWNGRIGFNKTGKTGCRIYAYNYKKKKYESKPFACIKFNVKNVKTVSEIKILEEKSEKSFSKIKSLKKSYNNMGSGEDDYFDGICDFKYYVYQDSYNYTGGYGITSSDPGIASVSEVMYEEYEGLFDEKTGYCGYFLIKPHKPGSCTITVEGNGASTSFEYHFSDYPIDGDFDMYCGTYTSKEKPDKSKFRFEISDDNAMGLTNCNLDVDIWRLEEHNDYADPELWCFGAKLIVNCYPPAKGGLCTLSVFYGDEELGHFELPVYKWDFTSKPLQYEVVENTGVEFELTNCSAHYFSSDYNDNRITYNVKFDRDKSKAKYVYIFGIRDWELSEYIDEAKKRFANPDPENLNMMHTSPYDISNYFFEKKYKDDNTVFVFTDENCQYVGHAVVKFKLDAA